MTFFASTYDWTERSLAFTVVGDGARDGSGEIILHNDRFVLKAPGCFSYATGQSDSHILRTAIDSRPALLRGAVFAIGGELGLRIDELRVGSDDDQPTYTEISAVFEHLGSICSYRLEDGAQRWPSIPISLPALDNAVQMVATLPSGVDAVRIASETAVVLDEFELHLNALQDLLTFASDLPVGRLSLEATEASGRKVEIHGRERFAPFGRRPTNPIEHQLRLSGEWTQTVIDRWWTGREALRPILQVMAGLRYQPAYVEADVIFSAAAIEALATRTEVGEQPRLSETEALPILAALEALSGLSLDQRQVVGQMKAEATRTTFQSKVDLLLAGLNAVALANSRVSIADWLGKFMKTRNDIAHGNGGFASDVWTDSALLRAVRDANRVLLSIAFLTHLGVPDAAVERAAERLGNRYSGSHRSTGIFR